MKELRNNIKQQKEKITLGRKKKNPVNGLFWAVHTYLADTLVVKETHSLTNVSGVVPVMSSHCAGVVPPEIA